MIDQILAIIGVIAAAIAALLAVLPLAWAELPGDVKAYLPPEWRPWVVTGLAVAVILGRLIKQGPAK